MSTLGSRIRELRKERDLTQDQLAAIVHVNRSTLANWEIGRASPDQNALKRLADYFGVSVDYLLGRSDLRDPSTPSWWYRDTPPTRVELEEFLKQADVYFNGASLGEEDKEDILDYLAWKWEREKRKREKESQQKK